MKNGILMSFISWKQSRRLMHNISLHKDMKREEKLITWRKCRSLKWKKRGGRMAMIASPIRSHRKIFLLLKGLWALTNRRCLSHLEIIITTRCSCCNAPSIIYNLSNSISQAIRIHEQWQSTTIKVLEWSRRRHTALHSFNFNSTTELSLHPNAVLHN